MDVRLMNLLGFLDQRIDVLTEEVQQWPDTSTEARLTEAREIRSYVEWLLKDSGRTS